MKKFRELYKAWRRGEKIEAEIAIPLGIVFVVVAFVIWLLYRWLAS